MINFRFHIISLTAVFLAFAIGLVLGTAFLDDATQRALDTTIDRLERDLRDSNTRRNELQAHIDDANTEAAGLDEELGQRLLPGTLSDVPVLVIASRGIDDELVKRTYSALEQANAKPVGTWWLTERLRLDDEDEVEDLASALEIDDDDVEALRAGLASELAKALSAAVDSTDDVAPPQDLTQDLLSPGGGGAVPGAPTDPAEPPRIERLHDNKFIDYEDVPDGDRVLLPSSGLRVVVVTGSGSVVPDGDVLLPTLTDATSSGPQPMVVAAAAPVSPEGVEQPDEANPLVEKIREEGELAERISTVDNLEHVSGRLATALALQAVGADPRGIGHYGLGEGAQQLLPPAP